MLSDSGPVACQRRAGATRLNIAVRLTLQQNSQFRRPIGMARIPLSRWIWLHCCNFPSHHRIDRTERPVLPVPDLLEHCVGDPRIRRRLDHRSASRASAEDRRSDRGLDARGPSAVTNAGPNAVRAVRTCAISFHRLRRNVNRTTFLSRIYSLHEGRIAGRRCIFLATADNTATPSDIAKHLALVRPAVDAIVVFVAPWLSAHNRSRLIGQGVPFVVPGKQLYIPDLAMDLRERFRTPKPRRAAGLLPAPQAVLFHRLLRLDEAATTPSLIATQLHDSAMSIGRAFDDLVSAGLAHSGRYGKERRIRFNAEGRQLFDASHDLLRSPVRTKRFIRDVHAAPALKHGGESTLSELTDPSPPPLPAFAVAATDWKIVAQTYEPVETDRDRASHIVETWSYDPAALSTAHTVDPLSLYAQFHDHRDERVSMAAELTSFANTSQPTKVNARSSAVPLAICCSTQRVSTSGRPGTSTWCSASRRSTPNSERPPKRFSIQADIRPANGATGEGSSTASTNRPELPLHDRALLAATRDLDLPEDVIYTRIPVDQDIVSLSAILLDDACYEALDGITIIDETLLIPFKAGGNVDQKDIRKHRNDVFRLAQLLPPDPRTPLPEPVRRDLRAFVDLAHADEHLNSRTFDVPFTRDEAVDRLRTVYRLT